MISDILAFRAQLAALVQTLAEMVKEGNAIAGADPDSIGFCEQARLVFDSDLAEINKGLAEKSARPIAHAILMVHGGVRQFSEHDLSWSRAPYQKLLEELSKSTNHLIYTLRVGEQLAELQGELRANAVN